MFFFTLLAVSHRFPRRAEQHKRGVAVSSAKSKAFGIRTAESLRKSPGIVLTMVQAEGTESDNLTLGRLA
jgi:uncharacterized ferredoxin-like protein